MSLISIVEEWNNSRLKDLVASYDREGLRASGRWAKSLEGITTQQGNIIKTVILGEQYTGSLIGGRVATKSKGDGTITLRQAIRQWIDDKGITPTDGISKDSLAFLISRKIHRQGIKVPNQYNSGNLISNVFTPAIMNNLSESIKEFLIQSIKVEVLKAKKNN